MRISNPEKIVRITTIAILAFVVCWGLSLVLWPLKPFWRDEWCVIYNLKFKTPEMLWGPLDFTQQFPRVYLQVIKWFTASLNYSYFSLRFPSYLIGVCTIFFAYALMKKLYPERAITRYLFPLIIVAHHVFIDYFGQVKQYQMETFLSLTALWQFMELLSIEKGNLHKGRYVLLCASLLLAPFFSYTYPIAIMPAFIIIFAQSTGLLKSREAAGSRNLLLQWLPLILCLCSMVVFYRIDVSHLMADKNMHNYWQFRMIGKTWSTTLLNLWSLFTKSNSGFLFELLFGIVGVCSFFCALIYNTKALRQNSYDTREWVELFCITLFLLVILLSLAGKLPLGEAKFTTFTVPQLAILIIAFIDRLQLRPNTRKLAGGVFTVSFLVLIAIVAAEYNNKRGDASYQYRIHKYAATEKALQLAREKKLPVLITPGIGLPDDITAVIPFISMPTAAGVLRTFPAFDLHDTVAIYDIKTLGDIEAYRQIVPPGTTAVIAGDGLTYTIVGLR